MITRTSCVTRSGGQKRGSGHEIWYGSWWKPTSVRPRGVSSRFDARTSRFFLLFLFFFLPQFPITALCPHHMSFTSNYRKLRGSPNMRIKVPATLASRSDGVPQKKQQRTRDGDGQRTGLLKRVRMLNTSEYDSGLEPPKKPKK